MPPCRLRGWATAGFINDDPEQGRPASCETRAKRDFRGKGRKGHFSGKKKAPSRFMRPLVLAFIWTDDFRAPESRGRALSGPREAARAAKSTDPNTDREGT